MVKIAVLISGTGRTLENIIKSIRVDDLPAEIKLVVSSKDSIRGNEIANLAGLRLLIIREPESIFHFLEEVDIDLVCLAGYTQLIPVPEHFHNRIINIHPSLLPSFGGKGFYGEHVHQAVLDHGCKVSGCTVHFVDNEYDHGPIILQKVVPVLDDDDAASLAARVFEQECIAYPEAIRLYAGNHLMIDNRKVKLF